MKPSSPFSRRHLISAALAGAVAGPRIALGAESKTDGFIEPERDIPLVEDADVIVCGAGPAGVSAAITAARAGARVRLFEWRGCLGGVWTAGLLGYLLDFDKNGFARELKDRLTERGYRRGDAETGICYEPEGMKLLLEELCVEAGVKFQLHTKVSAAYLEGGRLTTVVTESKSGREAWRAPVFIDTTGDGDLGALAGCGFEFGESESCPCQPMSLNALLCGGPAERGEEKPVPGRDRTDGPFSLLQQTDVVAGAGQPASGDDEPRVWRRGLQCRGGDGGHGAGAGGAAQDRGGIEEARRTVGRLADRGHGGADRGARRTADPGPLSGKPGRCEERGPA